MWTNIEVISCDDNIIYLPAPLEARHKKLTHVVFGSLSENVTVRFSEDLQFVSKSTFENPLKIRVSDKLREKLLIPDVLVYQLKFSEKKIIIGPVIGLLLGSNTTNYDPKHLEKYSDRFGIYNMVGGLIYAFSTEWINWQKRTAYGLYYNNWTGKWVYGYFPLPEVIYRRNFHSGPEIIEKLITLTKGKLFNSYRFTKLELYDVVSRDQELYEYLPPTEPTRDYYQVKRFIATHGKVILKPVDLSRGRGICIVEKTEKGYKVTDYRYSEPKVSVLDSAESLKEFFSINNDLFNRYLIQKYLSLARIDESVFDIRVVMQKDRERNWGCTGTECRVSNGKSHLTNISRGGYALSLSDALHKAFPKNCDYKQLSRQIYQFCLDFCECMDDTGEHFAELGIDVALDVNKNLWLIEANVFPSFKGFKTLNYKTYLKIRYNPFLYALSLTAFGD